MDDESASWRWDQFVGKVASCVSFGPFISNAWASNVKAYKMASRDARIIVVGLWIEDEERLRRTSMPL
jgi:hypothetical protein